MEQELITSLKYHESSEYKERIESSLKLILKDLHSKWILDEWKRILIQKW